MPRDVARYALLIGASRFEDTELISLGATEPDVKSLYETLTDPRIAGFRSEDVRFVLNEGLNETRSAIHWLFHGDYRGHRKRNDLLLLYYTGHGLRDPVDDDALYLALTRTSPFRAAATALESQWIRTEMARSPSQRKVAILDCCFSGAAAPIGWIPRRSTSSPLRSSSFVPQGYGSVVLTSSQRSEASFEFENASIYTTQLVAALRNGSPTPHEPYISVQALHEWLSIRVRKASNGAMTPTMHGGMSEPLIIAANQRFDTNNPRVADALPRTGKTSHMRSWKRTASRIAVIGTLAAFIMLQSGNVIETDLGAPDVAKSEEDARPEANLPGTAPKPATPVPTIDTIKSAQAEMKRLGYYDSAIDGVWGPRSISALRAFEAGIGVAPTGDRRSLHDLLPRMLMTPTPAAPVAAGLDCTIVSDSLGLGNRLFSAPSHSSAQMGTVSFSSTPALEKKRVAFANRYDWWYKISTDGKTGWVTGLHINPIGAACF